MQMRFQNYNHHILKPLVKFSHWIILHKWLFLIDQEFFVATTASLSLSQQKAQMQNRRQSVGSSLKSRLPYVLIIGRKTLHHEIMGSGADKCLLMNKTIDLLRRVAFIPFISIIVFSCFNFYEIYMNISFLFFMYQLFTRCKFQLIVAYFLEGFFIPNVFCLVGAIPEWNTYT